MTKKIKIGKNQHEAEKRKNTIFSEQKMARKPHWVNPALERRNTLRLTTRQGFNNR